MAVRDKINKLRTSNHQIWQKQQHPHSQQPLSIWSAPELRLNTPNGRLMRQLSRKRKAGKWSKSSKMMRISETNVWQECKRPGARPTSTMMASWTSRSIATSVQPWRPNRPQLANTSRKTMLKTITTSWTRLARETVSPCPRCCRQWDPGWPSSES